MSAEIADLVSWFEDNDSTDAGRNAAFASVNAVLELHQPREAQNHYGDRRLCCKSCHVQGQRPVWPCTTVAAIASAVEAVTR